MARHTKSDCFLHGRILDPHVLSPTLPSTSMIHLGGLTGLIRLTRAGVCLAEIKMPRLSSVQIVQLTRVYDCLNSGRRPAPINVAKYSCLGLTSISYEGQRMTTGEILPQIEPRGMTLAFHLFQKENTDGQVESLR